MDRFAITGRVGVIRLVVLLAMLLLPAAWARAADIAEFAALGFSQDGSHFAFEEYGISDGSGFAFSTIYVIDLKQDRWAEGSPVMVRQDDEVVSLAATRQAAQDLGRPVLERAGIEAGAPVRVLGATTPLETGGQELMLAFYPRPILTPIDPLHMLSLEQIALDSPRDCFGMVETAGFMLSLEVAGHGSEVIHRDTRLPQSRQCPARYGIAAVITPYEQSFAGLAVVLISVYQLGFEGLDRRFFAVPVELTF